MGSAPPSFEELLASSTGKNSNIVSGCVLAAVDRSGDYFYHKAAGDGGVQKDAKPLDVEAIFWIASCTKLLTSVCALQQVEKGKITLDDDITVLCPELKDLPVLVEDESSPDGYTEKPRKNKITLRLLLSHSSGMGYEFMSPLIAAWRQKNGPSKEELAPTVVKAYSTPFLFEPGEGWVYGAGIDWAGIAAARLDKQTLGEYMEEHIFKPLGMTSSSFHIDKRPDLMERVMPCSRREDNGSLTHSETNGYPTRMNEESGGGGLWSSVTDYMKVLADLISPNPKLLKPETITSMLAAPQMPADGKGVSDLSATRFGAVAMNAVAMSGTPPINYGCGGMVTLEDTTVLPAKSLSWGGLPNLKWFLNREQGVAAMYATQILPAGDATSIELSNQFFVEVLRLHKEKQGK